MNRNKTMSAPKTVVRQATQRHSKRDNDATALYLREELQLLYKSLQHKNEELIGLERIILERDTSINGLTKECQRLASRGLSGTNVADNAKRISSSAATKSFSSNIERDRLAKQNEIASERSDSSVVVNTSSDAELIREQNETIKELNEKVIRLTRNINFVQRDAQSKDERITELQNEIDKFKAIVRPITQAMIERNISDKKCNCMDEWSHCISGIGDWSPGLESTRVLPVSEPRIKRQAFSAEPLSALAQVSEEDGLVRIPKSSL